MTRLSQLYSDYSQLTTRSKRINYLKRLLQEKDVHGAMSGDPESDSEGSSLENLGDVTQFGLTGALAQMANLTFMAGAPELIQEADKQISDGPSGASGSTETEKQLSKGEPGSACKVGRLQHVKPVLSPSVSSAVDGGETSGESPQAQRTNILVDVLPNDDTQDTDDEADIMAAVVSRGRRSAVVAPKPSQKRKSIVEKQARPKV
ncbi:hypothetical protein OS493_006804 [Desmophyllum pertusum]|uniref:Uncharacterized protein n=1 Tax=Desmophyllum pertusum TaxID=174260 RepID=A0A9W9ZRU5_9CNID|nr:hypothetical protein OS493_006804 [Desmophyllum pertusum]